MLLSMFASLDALSKYFCDELSSFLQDKLISPPRLFGCNPYLSIYSNGKISPKTGKNEKQNLFFYWVIDWILYISVKDLLSYFNESALNLICPDLQCDGPIVKFLILIYHAINKDNTSIERKLLDENFRKMWVTNISLYLNTKTGGSNFYKLANKFCSEIKNINYQYLLTSSHLNDFVDPKKIQSDLKAVEKSVASLVVTIYNIVCTSLMKANNDLVNFVQ